MAVDDPTAVVSEIPGTADSMPPVTRFAAIDIGTNSVHLVIAEISPQGDFRVLGREKDMVQIGKGGFSEHRLTDEAMDAGILALRRFKKLAESQDVKKFRVVATSAVREAHNGGEFVTRVREELGLRVTVIPADEEGRLIYLGVRHAMQLAPVGDADDLIVDIGGGSVECIACNAQQAWFIQSVKLGGARMAELFLHADPPEANDIKAMRQHLRKVLDPVLDRIGERPVRRCIVTSGAARSIATICAKQRPQPLEGVDNELRIPRAEARELKDRLLRMTRAERLALPGMDEKRVDSNIPALFVFLRVMQRFKFDTLVHCDFALREGVMIDYIAKHRQKLAARATWPNPRTRSVVSLAERCNYRRQHSQQVAALARVLFDQLASLHELDYSYKELLSHAALLHDIGHLISHEGHHKHSYYLIRNGSLKGFSEQEVEVIANVARYHRKERPKKGHFSFKNLKPVHRRPVRKLAVLLRLADALDRNSFSVVHSLRCRLERERVEIEIYAQQDAEIEMWCAKRHADLFEREFDRELDVVLHEED